MNIGSNLLLIADGTTDLILIFCSIKAKYIFKDSYEYFMDGTFYDCCK